MPQLVCGGEETSMRMVALAQLQQFIAGRGAVVMDKYRNMIHVYQVVQIQIHIGHTAISTDYRAYFRF
ncbi:hypothetical protein SDC9_200658 [bioreactor metagenome]|uniref:Uncharacterized protein n=1 Tax=bioreactor metagenome TaxID=1076179 RepID=A0A645INS3_9ZZZZ